MPRVIGPAPEARAIGNRAAKASTEGEASAPMATGATAGGAGERLQKALANAGHGSRREIEGWIAAGRVHVDGQRAELGQRVTGNEKISLDGTLLEITRIDAPPRVFVLHKPLDFVCTRRDPDGRPTVFTLLPATARERWVMVGRLDVNTSGLLLFTDWGELANRLMHPRYGVEREYAVRVYGKVEGEALDRLLRGVESEGETLAFDRIVPGAGSGMNRWYHCMLHMGRNRAVRRAFEALGVRVSRLIRIRFGSVSLPRDIEPGEYRELGAAEIAKLARQVGLAVPDPAVPRRRRPK